MAGKKSTAEVPHIELYMYSLNQEFSVGKGHRTFLKRSSELKNDSSDGLVEINQLEQQVFEVDSEVRRAPDVPEPPDLPMPPDQPIPPDLPIPPDFPIPPDGGVHDNHVKWLSNEWIKNHTKAVGVGLRPEFDPLRTSILREEEFGAIVFEPRSDRVYKLNTPAAKLFHIFQELHRQGDGVIEITTANFKDFKIEDVSLFVDQLKAMGLWGISS